MQPNNFIESFEAISVPRLNSYRSFFSPKTDAELYGLYSWNEAISGSFFRLISSLEICLRNSFHRSLSNHFSAVTTLGGINSNDWYNHIGLKGKAADSVKKITHFKNNAHAWVPKNPPPSPDDVVSRLTLGFWRHLLDLKKDAAGQNIDWGSILTQAFPNYPNSGPIFWKKQSHQDRLFARMEFVADFRNRIAHFEPIWKLKELMEEKRQRPGVIISVAQPAPKTPADALNRLRLNHNRTVELLHWLSSHRATDYTMSYTRNRLIWLTSPAGVDAYKALQPTMQIPVARYTREHRRLAKSGSVVEITKGVDHVGTYYPLMA